MDIKILLIIILFMIPSVTAIDTTINRFTTVNDQDEFIKEDINQTYAYSWMIDDIGSMTNNCDIYDIDNDTVNELVCAEYNGFILIGNYSGLKENMWEYRSADYGTLYITSASAPYIRGGDNNGNGCTEYAMIDYSDTSVVIWEWCENTFTLINEIDLGENSQGYNSPTWCDIDNDGDLDVIGQRYAAGKITWLMYDAGSFSSVWVDPTDRGTYHYNTGCSCGDILNKGYNSLACNTNDGVMRIYNKTASVNQLSLLYTDADRGNYYSRPYIGNFIGDEKNYIINCVTTGICYFYNITNGLVLLDSSADFGSMTYGSSNALYRNIDGKDSIYFANSAGRPLRVWLESYNDIQYEFIAPNPYRESYSGIGMPRINSTDNTSIIIYTDRYDGDIYVSQNNQLINMEYGITSRIDWTNQYGFLYANGVTCGQIDHSTESDECIVFDYAGHGFVYTYQNVSKFSTYMRTAPELALLDIMPRDSTKYLIGNKTYCVNEQKNLFLNGEGQGNINPWIYKYYSNGASYSTTLLTDGTITEGDYVPYQTSAVYSTYSSSTYPYIRINLTKTPQLGMIKLFGYVYGQYDPRDLTVELSDTTCSNENLWVTIFDEKSGTDVSGASTYDGLKIYFLPQTVGCIRINASGTNYFNNPNGYSSSMYWSEIEAYYGNNCTFYVMPIEDIGAEFHEDYNISITTRIYKQNTPYKVSESYAILIGEIKSEMISVLDYIKKIFWTG